MKLFRKLGVDPLFHTELIWLVFVVILPYHPGEALGIPLLHDWSRRLADFLAQSALAMKFISGQDPVTTQRLIRLQGYPVEVHNVTTEDGYILQLHRIPFGAKPQSNNSSSPKVPVIVMHGGLGSSADWVANSPVEDSLALLLADRGYDVWLGNMRGNDYSKRHISLTPVDAKYWDYTMHEIGYYDIATHIDYVTNVTGQPKVLYTGVSMGCGTLTILLSQRPEFNSKVIVAAYMAPGGGYQTNSFYGFINLIAPLFPFLDKLSNSIGQFPAIPFVLSNMLKRVLPVLCHQRVDIFGLCVQVLYSQYGNDGGLITSDKMSLITSIAPSPLSFRSLLHGFQSVGFRDFLKYDYGITENVRRYGNERPPPYNLTNIQIPISIQVGLGDKHVTAQDARMFGNRLPNLINFQAVPHPLFNHVDFTYARGAGHLVYRRIVEIFDAFTA